MFSGSYMNTLRYVEQFCVVLQKGMDERETEIHISPLTLGIPDKIQSISFKMQVFKIKPHQPLMIGRGAIFNPAKNL